MAEKNYQITSVNHYGHVSNTNIIGTHAEGLADRHFNDLKADERTKYVVLMVVDGKGPGNIRSEYHRKNTEVVTKAADFPPRSRSDYAIHMSTRVAGGDLHPAHVWRTMEGNERIHDTALQCLNDIVEYEKKLLADSVQKYEEFWAVTGRDYDRWGRKVNRSAGPVS